MSETHEPVYANVDLACHSTLWTWQRKVSNYDNMGFFRSKYRCNR